MKLTLELDGRFPNLTGELVLYKLNPYQRWGYQTRDFYTSHQPIEVDLDHDLIEATICCGSSAKTENNRISKYKVWIDTQQLLVYLYWDGDGVIVIKNEEEGWVIYNTDMKCDSYWKSLDKDDWVYNLPENYYDQ